MKEQNKLTLQMSLLFFVVFVFFGVVIVNEKLSPLKIPKITERIEIYLKDNYEEELDQLELDKVQYKNLRYEAKVKNKDNSKLYFKVMYENKKITDTYKKDYLEGRTLIKSKEKEIQNNIKKVTKAVYKIQLDKLNTYKESEQKELITNKKPETLRLYNLEANVSVEKLKEENIINVIQIVNTNASEKNINPRTYTFKIKSDKKTLCIKNIPYEVIESEELNTIINDIITKKESKLLTQYNIEYEYQ
ncbi:MAG: hypothetical protein IJ193_04290 [Bacilli bacterium]|nr:hypothetical protein [Bacilli bacterium]